MIATYARVSGEEQAQKGYSLSDQLAATRTLAAGPVQEYIDDGYSGEFLERPALDRLRDDIRAGLIHTVIMYDPDRMSRNLTNQLILADEFEKYRVKLRFVTGDYDASPEGRLFFNMKGAISAYEKGKIKERTSRGKRKKVLSGRILQPNTPYGYDWDAENENYIINDTEAEIVRYIYQEYCDSVGPLELAKRLLSQGIRNRSGRPFSPNHIWRIVSNETYAGTCWQFATKTTKISQYKSKEEKRPKEEQVAVTVPAIVSPETYALARQVAANNKQHSKRNSKQVYMLSGALVCKVCGHSLIGTPIKYKDKVYRYYSCSKNKHSFYFNDRCSSRLLPAEALEETVWSTLTDAVKSGAFSYPELKTKSIASTTMNPDVKIAELTKKKKQLMKWFRDGLIEPSEVETELKKIQQDILALSEYQRQAAMQAEKQKSPTFITQEDIELATTPESKNKLLISHNIKIAAAKVEDVISIDFV